MNAEEEEELRAELRKRRADWLHRRRTEIRSTSSVHSSREVRRRAAKIAKKLGAKSASSVAVVTCKRCGDVWTATEVWHVFRSCPGCGYEVPDDEQLDGRGGARKL